MAESASARCVQLSYDMIDRTDRETLPPAAPDAEAADFEAAISERGESSARWDRLMALLSHSEERGVAR